ncbi:hypothetical protein ACFLQR_04150, partial [Verrucomicrobiota bacterium]
MNRERIRNMSACWKQVVCGTLLLSFVGFADAVAANSRQEDDRSYLLTESDVDDFRALVIKLRNGRDPVSLFLRNRCSRPTRELIYSYHAGTPPSDELRNGLINDLNRVIQRESIYEEERFADVSLSSLITISFLSDVLFL